MAVTAGQRVPAARVAKGAPVGARAQAERRAPVAARVRRVGRSRDARREAHAQHRSTTSVAVSIISTPASAWMKTRVAWLPVSVGHASVPPTATRPRARWDRMATPSVRAKDLRCAPVEAASEAPDASTGVPQEASASTRAATDWLDACLPAPSCSSQGSAGHFPVDEVLKGRGKVVEVDRTLIQWALLLAPLERLRAATISAASLDAWRNAKRDER